MYPNYVFLSLLPKIIPKDPEWKSFFRNSKAKVSWSQFGEDIQVIDIFRSKIGVDTSGFFVDIGAFHPGQLSNTFALYLQGWTGINVDPIKESIQIFNKYRGSDININKAVRNYVGETSIYRGMYSGESSVLPEWDFGHVEERKVKCTTMNALLEKHLPKDTNIDLLSIDVEGVEDEVFSEFDIEKYRPKVILVEIHANSIPEVLESSIYQYLFNAGYVYKSQCSVTSIFVDSRIIVNRTPEEQRAFITNNAKQKGE
jgi:FkbM family methyltransferase